jgi:hypothetical protein
MVHVRSARPINILIVTSTRTLLDEKEVLLIPRLRPRRIAGSFFFYFILFGFVDRHSLKRPRVSQKANKHWNCQWYWYPGS